MSNDPQRLILYFDDLRRSLITWTTQAELFNEETLALVREASILISQLSQEIRFKSEQINSAQQTTQIISDEAGRTLVDSQKAKDLSAKAETDAKGAEAAAMQAVARWQSGLDRARSALAAAQDWRNRAKTALTLAQNRLSAAVSAYNAAVRSLNSCQSSYTVDSKGNRRYRNCSFERSRVNSAQSEVNAAQSAVNTAQAELRRAEAEVQRCTGIVSACESGLARAISLRHDGTALRARASHNIDQANRALNDADTAVAQGHSISQIMSRLIEVFTDLESQGELTSESLSGVSLASDQVRDLTREQQNLLGRARSNLTTIEDQLLVFDKPEASL